MNSCSRIVPKPEPPLLRVKYMVCIYFGLDPFKQTVPLIKLVFSNIIFSACLLKEHVLLKSNDVHYMRSLHALGQDSS